MLISIEEYTFVSVSGMREESTAEFSDVEMDGDSHAGVVSDEGDWHLLTGISHSFLLRMYRTLTAQKRLSTVHNLKQPHEPHGWAHSNTEYWYRGKWITTEELHHVIKLNTQPSADIPDVLSPVDNPVAAMFSEEHQRAHGLEPLTNIKV